jgi:hypothetical protein
MLTIRLIEHSCFVGAWSFTIDMFVFLGLLLLQLWLLVISEGVQSQLLPLLIWFSPPIFLAPKFSARAPRAPVVSRWDFSAAFFLSIF